MSSKALVRQTSSLAHASTDEITRLYIEANTKAEQTVVAAHRIESSAGRIAADSQRRLDTIRRAYLNDVLSTVDTAGGDILKVLRNFEG